MILEQLIVADSDCKLLRSAKPLSPLAVVVGLFGAVRYSVGQLTAPRDVDAPLNRHIVARPW